MKKFRSPVRASRAVALGVCLALALAVAPLSTSQADEPKPSSTDGPQQSSRNEPTQAEIVGVADANDLSRGEAGQILSDPTVRVNSEDRLYVVDPAPDPATAGRASAVPPSVALAPLSETFSLHSKPESSRVIYLDFDGHTVSGTAWNSDEGVSSGFHPGWDPDSDGAAFSDNEKAMIQDVFFRVAEDFAALDVDVTTDQPAAGDIRRDSAADASYGTRALISPSTQAANAICGGTCGGVAYFGAFDEISDRHDELQPAWVFPQSLSEDPKSVAEATSHEVGHNLWLQHDGIFTDSTRAYYYTYYRGHGGWAPIMGTSYDQPTGQWSKGEYTLATNTENDFALMAENGVVERADEASDTTAGAQPVVSGKTAYISSEDDVDVFSLANCLGNVTIDANPAASSPNLDIELRVLDSAGNTQAIDNPTSARVDDYLASGMDATIQRQIAPGSYVAVDGVGRGTADDGYSDYGSVGEYTLELSGCEAPVLPGALAIRASQRDVSSNSFGLAWTAPSQAGTGGITGYEVTVDDQLVGSTAPGATSYLIKNFDRRAHKVGVRGVNIAGTGPAANVGVGPALAPGKPRNVKGKSGKRGGKATVLAKWGSAPVADASTPVLKYRVLIKKLGSKKAKTKVIKASRKKLVAQGKTGQKFRFKVRARNVVGWGKWSTFSKTAKAR